jgi:hypothetical protein
VYAGAVVPGIDVDVADSFLPPNGHKRQPDGSASAKGP